MKTTAKTKTIIEIANDVGVHPKTARAKLRALPAAKRPKTAGEGWTFAMKSVPAVERVIAA